MLTAEKIDVFYGDMQALWDVSFHIDEGEIVAIVGANGSGKTTLMNTISGFLRPKSGRLDFSGKRIDGLSVHEIVRLGISHVPEGRLLFSKMTVLENLELGAYLVKENEEVAKRLETVYQLFPVLKERSGQKAGTLSGGEGQMLAIGRCLMSNPRLAMLDEISLGLAPKAILAVFEAIRAINQEGVTILLVEQNLRHALELATRGYVLETGRIVLEDDAKTLLKNDYVKKTYLGY